MSACQPYLIECVSSLPRVLRRNVWFGSIEKKGELRMLKRVGNACTVALLCASLVLAFAPASAEAG